MWAHYIFLTNSNGFEMANEHGMGIRKTRLGTLRVLSGLNVTVTDGVAIRTAIISSLLPKLLFLSQFQISCLTVRLGVRGRVLWPQDQGDGLEKTVRKRQTIHSTDVYCVRPLCIHCCSSWVTRVNKTENALALVELTFYLGETDNET